MRRMRGFAWYHVLFAIPALAVAFGIQYFMRKHFPSTPNPETSAVTRPSYFKGEKEARSVAADTSAKPMDEVKPVGTSKKKRDKATKTTPDKSHDSAPPQAPGTKATSHLDDHQQKVKSAEKIVAATPAVPAAPAKKEVLTETQTFHDTKSMQKTISAVEKAGEKLAGPKLQRLSSAPETPASSNTGFTDRVDVDGLNVSTTAIKAGGTQCMSVEFRGDGPSSVITPKDWSKVVDQFLEAKKDLTTWMERNKKGFPEKTLALMDRQLRTVKLQKPPVAEEADLAWRGIGVYGTDSTRNPVVRIGPGFVKLAVRQPARAKFEMMRLLAQSWAPCELGKEDAFEPWAPLLSCLQISEKQACSVGSVSEGGWAVSSTLAAMLAPPGCGLPAFHEPAMAKCLQKFPFPVGANAPLIAQKGTAAAPAAVAAERAPASTDTPAASVPAAVQAPAAAAGAAAGVAAAADAAATQKKETH